LLDESRGEKKLRRENPYGEKGLGGGEKLKKKVRRKEKVRRGPALSVRRLGSNTGREGVRLFLVFGKKKRRGEKKKDVKGGASPGKKKTKNDIVEWECL